MASLPERDPVADLPELTVSAVLPDLLGALARNRAAVLVAPPGAGKTTLVPLALRGAAWLEGRRIVMLEPRRLAARGAAARMATLLGEPVGASVGYRVRMETRVSAATRIEVVTEGVFTRMILDDPELAGIGAVLFDEFHERSLDADLGLALALDARALREDLRIVVMSATLDGAAVARLMGAAPVIEAQGRLFPVETHYRDRDPLRGIEQQMAGTVREALRADTGSVLAFLPGEAEIHRTAEALAGHLPGDVDPAPLYGRLDAAEQDRAIRPAPPGRRKLVLATAIAESSLTIDGIRIVIDSGLARRPAYDPATGLTSLVTRPVSRASAEQRRGRAGRMAPGVCYRLWNEGQTAGLMPFDPPEMLSADLGGLVLSLAAWGVTDPGQLRFLDPPPAPAWAEAVALLRALDALDTAGHLTAEGRALVRLPLPPRLAHMVNGAGRDGDAGTAAELAVLLTEHGLGGTDIDLGRRLEHFRRERGPRAAEARRLAARWAALAGENRVAGNTDPGRHLARAYPDRVAQRAGQPGRFRLANGRAATLDAADPLAGEAFLVVADIAGSAAAGRIRAAAAISLADIEALFGGRIIEEQSLAFDAGARALRARKRRRLGRLVLADQPQPVPADDSAATVLAAGIAGLGAAVLPFSREQQALRARAGFLRQRLGPGWPDLSDAALTADGAGWLAPFLAGKTALADITAADLGAALDTLLPWASRAEMDRLLPTHFTAPSGSRVPIDYEAEAGPALAIRVQELFGLDAHPAVGGGRIPLRLILLSPAHRPIQTTMDLPGFWRGSWHEVARDLKGRYPRHFWPDDPLSAPATNRAKPRGQ